MKLFANPECWKFIEDHPNEFNTFGCGPGGMGDRLVPDTVWGLDISLACKIHDWDYRLGPGITEGDRKEVDKTLLNNSLRIVKAMTKCKALRWLRNRRCRTYYGFVRVFGGPGYFDERNLDSEYRDINEMACCIEGEVISHKNKS